MFLIVEGGRLNILSYCFHFRWSFLISLFLSFLPFEFLLVHVSLLSLVYFISIRLLDFGDMASMWSIVLCALVAGTTARVVDPVVREVYVRDASVMNATTTSGLHNYNLSSSFINKELATS